MRRAPPRPPPPRTGLAAPSGLLPARKIRTKHTTARNRGVPLLSTLPPTRVGRARPGPRKLRPTDAIPRPRPGGPAGTAAQAIVGAQGTLLDLVDNLLNR